MKPRFVKTRQFVNENKTYLAFCAGSIATSTAIILINKDVTLLRLPKNQQEMLKEGYSIVYQLKDQTLTLGNIPAIEAAQAVAQ